MTTVLPEIDELTIIDLDFEYIPPCEHSQHMQLHTQSEPASWIARIFPCEHGGRYLICDSGRRRFLMLGCRCHECGVIYPPGEGMSFSPLVQNTA